MPSSRSTNHIPDAQRTQTDSARSTTWSRYCRRGAQRLISTMIVSRITPLCLVWITTGARRNHEFGDKKNTPQEEKNTGGQMRMKIGMIFFFLVHLLRIYTVSIITTRIPFHPRARGPSNQQRSSSFTFPFKHPPSSS